MRKLTVLTLYAALALGAIAVLGPHRQSAAQADTGHLMALATGELAKVQFSGAPTQVPGSVFTTPDGTSKTLADYRGQHVVLNFWALWCAPCVKEMPELNALSRALGPEGLAVVTVATGRNAPARVDAFFADKQLDALPKLYDPRMAMAQDFAAMGLPVTVLIDPEGREIARANGALDWSSPEALNLFRAWMAGS